MQERIAPPVPLSLVGQKPENFFALAQQRQQEQQKIAVPQPPVQQESVKPEKDDEENDSDDALKNHSLVPRPEQPVHRPQPQQQRRPQQPERPVERRQQDIEKPEPSGPPPIQHRSRPNYPAGYRPRPQQVVGFKQNQCNVDQ